MNDRADGAIPARTSPPRVHYCLARNRSQAVAPTEGLKKKNAACLILIDLQTADCQTAHSRVFRFKIQDSSRSRDIATTRTRTLPAPHARAVWLSYGCTSRTSTYAHSSTHTGAAEPLRQKRVSAAAAAATAASSEERASNRHALERALPRPREQRVADARPPRTNRRRRLIEGFLRGVLRSLRRRRVRPLRLS